MAKNKLILNKCEIEGCQETENLHLHHIIERTELNTNNHPFNLSILCPNHHAHVHSGRLKIIGVFPSTQLPNKRTLIYELDGKKNVDIDRPYIQFTNKSFKIHGESNE
jgi:hypothetical protein